MEAPKHFNLKQKALWELREAQWVARQEKQRKSSQKWRQANLEKHRLAQRQRYWRDPEKHRKAAEERRLKDPEKFKDKSHRSYLKSKSQAAADQFFTLTAAAEQISKIPKS